MSYATAFLGLTDTGWRHVQQISQIVFDVAIVAYILFHTHKLRWPR